MDASGDEGVVLEEVIRADRMVGVDLSAPQVQAALDALGRDIKGEVGQRGVVVALRRRKQRKAAAVGLIAAALLAAGTPAAAQWVGLHTGWFGSADSTENDTSEFLDTSSPELGPYLDQLARNYRLPPGGTFDQVKHNAARHKGLAQRGGLENMIATESECQWSKWWLDGHRSGNSAKVAAATKVLQEVPTWPMMQRTDDTGQAFAKERAIAAANGNPTPIQENFQVNCVSDGVDHTDPDLINDVKPGGGK